jgi:Zn finger protein HypA/HybF involved in hydrogenase expression
MEKTIYKVTVEQEFRICPECGYTDGFHTMLKKEAQAVKWLFICPACHKIFDIGCTIDPFAKLQGTAA